MTPMMQTNTVLSPSDDVDVLRAHPGAPVIVRPARPDDAVGLQDYFRGLSSASRYARLMGAVSELPARELDKFTHVSASSFPLVVTLQQGDGDIIVGEARTVLDDQNSRRGEFALSIADALHGRGLGRQLLANLECRAVAAGAQVLFGSALRTNAAMITLARSQGYTLAATPGDWKQVQFEKLLAASPRAYPCASARRMAALAV